MDFRNNENCVLVKCSLNTIPEIKATVIKAIKKERFFLAEKDDEN